VLLVYVVVTFLAASLVLVPIALWLVARWAVAPPAAVVEGLAVRPALTRSTALTRGRRWRSLFLTVLVAWVAFTLPGVVGALLLLLTGLSFGVTNLVAIALMAVLLPTIGIGLTLMFFDLRHRVEGEQPAPAEAAVGG
jgi:uncharacterized membrane protein